MKKLKNKLEELPKDLFQQILDDSENFTYDLKMLYNTKRKVDQRQLAVKLRSINQELHFVVHKMHTLLSDAWNKRILKDV